MKNKITRRSCLQLLGLSALGAAAGVSLAMPSRFGQTESRISRSQRALGTHVDISAIGHAQAIEDAMGAAFEDVEALERIFTHYDGLSPVCEVNERRQLKNVPAPLAGLLDVCQQYHRETQGAFDITVKPLIDLFATGKRPSESEIAEVSRNVGAHRLHWDGANLALDSHMEITFDGAVPGLVADHIARVLERHGIQNYLVNAGGEIRTSGHAKHGAPWRVAIQDPNKKGNFPGMLELRRGAVSTSGNYEIFYDDDRMFHHIVDARTGHSPSRFSSVTVTAPTALQADILSTALFVMAPTEALHFANTHKEIECLLIEKSGKQHRSKHFPIV